MMNWHDAPGVSRWLLVALSTRSQITYVCGMCQSVLPINMLLHVPMAKATSILETSLRRL
jgi:hypothetical protein